MDISQTKYIPKEQLTVIFISDYYDLPIRGLAIYKTELNKQIIRFDCSSTLGHNETIYRIEQLCPEELAYEMAEKEAFERYVGRHWSFNPDTGAPLQKCCTAPPADLSQAYYENQRQKQLPSFPPSVLLGWSDQLR